eukprot:gene30878-40188_t
MKEEQNFSIGLFELGDCKSCLFSWCCPPCALAASRTQLDDSGILFNYFCLPIIPYRWMVRSAYGIGDLSSCAGDCLLPIFCTCCVVNQLYQTTSRLGNPTTDGGKAFNTNDMLSVGMPWIMGCCCFNLFNARNVLRYQYRLRSHNGSDCVEECLIPYMVYYLLGSLATMVACFIPCCYPCLFVPFCGAVVATDMAMLQEAEIKKGGENKSYLKGYSPAPAAATPQYVTYVNLPNNGPFQPSGARVVPYNKFSPAPTGQEIAEKEVIL